MSEESEIRSPFDLGTRWTVRLDLPVVTATRASGASVSYLARPGKSLLPALLWQRVKEEKASTAEGDYVL